MLKFIVFNQLTTTKNGVDIVNIIYRLFTPFVSVILAECHYSNSFCLTDVAITHVYQYTVHVCV